jgi:hypothetical protein
MSGGALERFETAAPHAADECTPLGFVNARARARDQQATPRGLRSRGFVELSIEAFGTQDKQLCVVNASFEQRQG